MSYAKGFIDRPQVLLIKRVQKFESTEFRKYQHRELFDSNTEESTEEAVIFWLKCWFLFRRKITLCPWTRLTWNTHHSFTSKAAHNDPHWNLTMHHQKDVGFYIPGMKTLSVTDQISQHDWALPPILGEHILVLSCKQVTKHHEHKSLGVIRNHEETQWKETQVGRGREFSTLLIRLFINSEII